MRRMLRSNEFDEFFKSQPLNVQNKVKYAINIIAEIKIVNSKLVKNLLIQSFTN